MSDRGWHVGICGTFDVQNYGDLLFPIIAEAELSKRLDKVTLHRFSYHAKAPPDWPYAVTSVTELPHLASSLDGILIGGGFLIRFDKDVAPDYGPPTTEIHHPTGYWLTPALIALQHGIPLIWNAPGMHCNEIPAWAGPLLSLAFAHSRYIAVRDQPSQSGLAGYVDKARISVVPDTAFRLATLLTATPSAELGRLCAASGLTGPYIIIQAALGLDSFLRFIKTNNHRLQEYQFLALPIGPVLTDHSAILEAWGLPRLVTLPFWPEPLLLAELISQAAGVVGHSYHLAITALAFGVPAFTPVPLSVGKYSALQRFGTVYQLSKDAEPDPDWFLQRLGRTRPSTAVQAAVGLLDQHWDRVATAIVAGPSATQLSMDHFWQSLPSLLEDPTVRRDAVVKDLNDRHLEEQKRVDELEHQVRLDRADTQALEAQNAKVKAKARNCSGAWNSAKTGAEALQSRNAAMQGRVDTLEAHLNLSRREIGARDSHIAALYGSLSWSVTAPLRFLRGLLSQLCNSRITAMIDLTHIAHGSLQSKPLRLGCS